MYLYISQRSIAYTIAWSNSFGAIWVYHVIMYLRPVYSKFCCAYIVGFYFYLRLILRLVRGAMLTATETAGFCLFTERENMGDEDVCEHPQTTPPKFILSLTLETTLQSRWQMSQYSAFLAICYSRFGDEDIHPPGTGLIPKKLFHIGC